MRVAIVSPYSWTYPGGVNRHIEALAAQLTASGHEVRVLAPWDEDTRATVLRHRGARPHALEAPEWLVPLGPTIGWASNGAVSNSPVLHGRRRELRRELRAGRLRRRPPARAGRAADRLGRAHVHRRAARRHLPLLLGERPAAQGRGAARRPPQAQSPHAPDRRLRGRGLDGPALLRRRVHDRPQRRRAARRRRPAAAPARCRASRWRSSSSARPSSARACRCCCAPSRRCASTRTCGSRSWAPTEAEVAPMLIERDGITVLGRVSDERKRARARVARTCWPRRRWAASRSAWSSPRRSPPGRRSSPPTSRATATSSATASTASSSRAGTRSSSPSSCAGSRTTRRARPQLGAARRRERRALRLAEGRRAGHRGLRGGAARCPQPEGADGEARRAHRHALRRPGAARARPPDAVARAAAAARPPLRRRAAPGRAGRGGHRDASPAPTWRWIASASTGSAARCSTRARSGCSSGSRSCASRWASAPSPGTRSSRPRCRRCGRGSSTPGRARRSAC